MAGPDGNPANFMSTQWSVVCCAGDSKLPDARQALSSLCVVYWYPIYSFFRRQVSTASEAEDLTQGFFAHLLEKKLIARVDRDKGRFRTYLLTCCHNYLANRRKYERAKRRSGDKFAESIDAVSAEERYRVEPSDGMTPDALFDRQWAIAVIHQAMTALEKEYRESNELDLFQRLKPVLTKDPEVATYAEIAADLGTTENVIKKSVIQARQRFRELLRAQVSDMLGSPDEVDEEIRELFKALSAGL